MVKKKNEMGEKKYLAMLLFSLANVLCSRRNFAFARKIIDFAAFNFFPTLFPLRGSVYISIFHYTQYEWVFIYMKLYKLAAFIFNNRVCYKRIVIFGGP